MDQGSTATASHTRPRGFSLRSDKSSEKGAGPTTANELAEKARRDSFLRGESKANPNAALNEVQPGVRNVMEKVTLDSLREQQHKDASGNIITEPDLSNPTRPRWERPLDTIRSFEKAIDGGYKRRSVSRAGSDFDSSYQSPSNRRQSYYGHEAGPAPSPRNLQSGAGYYGSRRADSYFDPYGSAPVAPPSRNRYGRNISESRQSYYGSGYGQQGFDRSYDANLSDSTGPWNNSTDPSSENSSLDRAHGVTKPTHTPEPMNGYPAENYGNGAIMEEGGSDDYGLPTRRGPSTPQQQLQQPRKTIQLGGGSGSPSDTAFAHQGGSLPPATRPTASTEKRKSFFGRKFGKNKD